LFAVEVRDHIMVAHSFRGAVFGPAQALHGATFVIDVAFIAQTLDGNGIVVDIGRAHDVLKSVLQPLNYRNLDDVPEFKGLVAAVDLAYTLRARTQFAIAARRDLEYSYLYEQNVYVVAGFTASVTQRVGDAWDVRGTVGRTHLTYQSRFQSLAVAVELTGETSLSAGVDVGYHIGRSRVGFNVDHAQRDSDVSLGRGYQRLVIGSSLSYVF